MNGYFENVVKEAISDLKAGHQAYVFYEDQIDELILRVKKMKWFQNNEVLVKEDNGVYLLSLKNVIDKKKIVC